MDRRVEVAGAGAHHQALERRQPHRGVDRLAHRGRRSRTRRCRGAARSGWSSSTGAAEQRRGRAARRRRARCRGTRSGGSGAPRATPAGRRRCRRDLGHRLVEGGVEDRDLRQVGEQPAGHRDALEVGRVVQRRERDELLDGRDHVVVDQRRARRTARRRARRGARPRPRSTSLERGPWSVERVDDRAAARPRTSRTRRSSVCSSPPTSCASAPARLTDPLDRARTRGASPVLAVDAGCTSATTSRR